MSDLPVDSAVTAPTAREQWLRWAVMALAALVFISWLLNTPEGVLGKADAVGYAICHRIDLRSFHLGDRQLPLCARCTGIYLGVLVGLGMMVAFGRTRAGALPPLGLLVALLGFIGVMGVDGVNSYLTLFPGLPHLYEPRNDLRLITGTFNGLALVGLIYPVFNQTLWRAWEVRPALGQWRELAAWVVGAVVVIGLVLTDDYNFLYLFAVLSSVGVVVLLTLLDTTVLLILTRRANRIDHWQGAVWPLLAGLTVAIAQIGAVDAVRYAVFGNWGGLPLP